MCSVIPVLHGSTVLISPPLFIELGRMTGKPSKTPRDTIDYLDGVRIS